MINAFYQQKNVTFNVLGPLMYLLDLTNLSLNSDIGVDAKGPEKFLQQQKRLKKWSPSNSQNMDFLILKHVLGV